MATQQLNNENNVMNIVDTKLMMSTTQLKNKLNELYGADPNYTLLEDFFLHFIVPFFRSQHYIAYDNIKKTIICTRFTLPYAAPELYNEFMEHIINMDKDIFNTMDKFVHGSWKTNPPPTINNKLDMTKLQYIPEIYKSWY